METAIPLAWEEVVLRAIGGPKHRPRPFRNSRRNRSPGIWGPALVAAAIASPPGSIPNLGVERPEKAPRVWHLLRRRRIAPWLRKSPDTQSRHKPNTGAGWERFQAPGPVQPTGAEPIGAARF